MLKTPITKYDYIAFLVRRIQENHISKQSVDWYFDEFCIMYAPLIYKTCRKVKNKVSYFYINEIRSRVLEIMFDIILRYDSKFNDKSSLNNDNGDSKNNKKFNGIYFSKYLKGRLKWDVYRVLKPPKIEYDDMHINTNSVQLNLNSPELIEKFKCEPTYACNPISNNFISLCRMVGKILQDDICADVMFLCYGYGDRPRNIAKALDCDVKKVNHALFKLKQFWLEKNNLELLVEK